MSVYEEYIEKRCEEMLLNNDTYKELNEKVISMEAIFKKGLSNQQLNQYNEIEEAIIACISCTESLLYKTGFSDGVNAK